MEIFHSIRLHAGKNQHYGVLFCYSTGLRSIFRNNSIFDSESYGRWKRDSVQTVDIVTGCFLMIDKKLWSSLRGFEQDFFMYGEDADLCLRAKKKGASANNHTCSDNNTLLRFIRKSTCR